MDLQTRKLTFIQEFLRLQSEEIISKLEFILEKQKAIAINIPSNENASNLELEGMIS